MFIVLLLAVTTLCNIAVIDAEGSGSSGGACQMEMRFFDSLETCYSATIATAFIYADGECHTVETDTSETDGIYSLMPGNYRAECSSDNTLIFIDSACINGSCSKDSTCNRNNSIGGSLFSIVPGQLVQDLSVVGNFFRCEQVYNSDNSVNFAVFGDCSLPGCSVAGVVNPATEPTSPTAPISTPTTISNPTDSPDTPTVRSSPSAVPATNPSMPAPRQPSTAAPIPSTASLAPTTRPAPRSPITAAPLTISPIATVPVTASPVAAPITASPIAVGSAPSLAPNVASPATKTPSITPILRSQPTFAPNSKTQSPTVVVELTSNPSSDVIEASSSKGGLSNLVLGVVGGVAFIAVISLSLLIRKYLSCCSSSSKSAAVTATTADKTGEAMFSSSNSCEQKHDRQTATNEIWFDPNKDDVSTLDGGTLPDVMNSGNGAGDEPTASVNLDFDYEQNKYRSGDERSRFTSSTSPTAYTSLSKLGISNVGPIVTDDDRTFEQHFADMDDTVDMEMHGHHKQSVPIPSNLNNMANHVHPFEVRAPPGMLGMVIDTPNGGVPVIQAIKPDSVLYERVQVGDRLILVDHQNVTSMTALEVSSLITRKQNHARFFVFCRLAPPPSPPSDLAEP